MGDFAQPVIVDSELQRAWKESLSKSERIGAAWSYKKANATSEVLTVNVPAWLDVVDGKIFEKPEMVEVVREGFKMSANGISSRHILRSLNGRLNGLTKSWLVRTLGNPAVLREYDNGTIAKHHTQSCPKS